MSTTNNESSALDKVQALLAEAIAIVEKMSSEEREAFRTSKTIREEPIDICERLDKDGFAVEVVAEGLEADGHEEFSVALRETAALEREAAAEIRRLRVVNEKLAVSESRSVQRQIEADATVLAETQNARAEGFRAGIEEAAQYCIEGDVLLPGQAKAMVRALADKPAPDALLPGLSASVGDDGCWLHFRTTDGNRSASFHIANKFNDHSFMDKTVRQWCSEREAARKGG